MLTFLGTAQLWVATGISTAVFIVALWALGDAIYRPAYAFLREGKRTKAFWLGLTALAAAIAFVFVYPRFSVSGLNILILVIPGIYLADVRPAVRGYGGGRGRQ